MFLDKLPDFSVSGARAALLLHQPKIQMQIRIKPTVIPKAYAVGIFQCQMPGKHPSRHAIVAVNMGPEPTRTVLSSYDAQEQAKHAYDHGIKIEEFDGCTHIEIIVQKLVREGVAEFVD